MCLYSDGAPYHTEICKVPVKCVGFVVVVFEYLHAHHMHNPVFHLTDNAYTELIILEILQHLGEGEKG